MTLSELCPSLGLVSSSIRWGRLMCHPKLSLPGDPQLPVPFLGGRVGSRLP